MHLLCGIDIQLYLLFFCFMFEMLGSVPTVCAQTAGKLWFDLFGIYGHESIYRMRAACVR